MVNRETAMTDDAFMFCPKNLPLAAASLSVCEYATRSMKRGQAYQHRAR
jgi:hypothetical protein